MRWPESLVDFPRQLYIPWRMSEGALLYQDVTSNYGPLSHLIEAGVFRIFGPGLDVIIGLGLGVMVVVLLLLRGIFGMIGDRLSAWLCSVVFLTAFAMPLYGNAGGSLYNYITPYSSEAVYGLAGCLLLVYALMRHVADGQSHWLLAAGSGLAIAFLCKTEILLAAAGALAMYWTVSGIRIWRKKNVSDEDAGRVVRFLRLIGWPLIGFLLVYLPVLFILASAGGWPYGFRAVNWGLRVLFDKAYSQAAGTRFQDLATGFDDPGTNLAQHLEWGILLVVCCAAVVWAGRQWQRSAATGQMGTGVLVFVFAACFMVAVLTDWLEIGRALLVPTLLVMLLAVGGSFRHAWRAKSGHEQLFRLAMVATAAMLMLARMLLNGRIYHYGFFLGVLAALLLVHVLIYEAPRFGQRDKPNLFLQVAFAFMVLICSTQLVRLSLANYAKRTYEVGSGRDAFYSYQPGFSGDGAILNIIIAAMQKHLSDVKTVVAFPESMAVNYHLRKPNPVADMQFTPDVLAMAGSANDVAELAAHPPEAIVIYARAMSEYHVPYFGADEDSGQAILTWVGDNYVPVFVYGENKFAASGHLVDIYLRRDLAAQR